MNTCLVCGDDSKRSEAAQRFAAGESLRAVAEAIGVSKSALDRCKRNHGLGQVPEASPCVPQDAPVEVVDSTTCPPITASEPESIATGWRVAAPSIRFITTSGTHATAGQGEVVNDVHPVFAAALERVGALRRT